jgi:hypothetical protein
MWSIGGIGAGADPAGTGAAPMLVQPAPQNIPVPPGIGRYADEFARGLGVAAERYRPPVAIQRRATVYAEDLGRSETGPSYAAKKAAKNACAVHNKLAPPYYIQLEPDPKIVSQSQHLLDRLRQEDNGSIDGKQAVSLFCNVATSLM